MTEKDPSGLDPHTPGAKLDAGKQRPGLVLGAFAHALQAVTAVGTYGAKKYSPNGWLHVDSGLERYTDAMLRHQLAELGGEKYDPDTGIAHAAHAAWNSLARLELMMRAADQPKADPRQVGVAQYPAQWQGNGTATGPASA
ncbi:MAG: dATP/dGTP diphosphohydrolase domain-containing protein [Leptothrix sp. (in: b-proteobacteria)]